MGSILYYERGQVLMAQDVALNYVNSELAILYGECDNCHELIRAEITPDSKQGELIYSHEDTDKRECAPRYAEPDIELRLTEGEYLEQIIVAMARY